MECRELSIITLATPPSEPLIWQDLRQSSREALHPLGGKYKQYAPPSSVSLGLCLNVLAKQICDHRIILVKLSQILVFLRYSLTISPTSSEFFASMSFIRSSFASGQPFTYALKCFFIIAKLLCGRSSSKSFICSIIT